jgi:UPF0176 protein
MEPTPVTFHVATFYKFVEIESPPQLRDWLVALCQAHGIIGSILVADEGINATISGSQHGVMALVAELQADPRFREMEVKYSTALERPFMKTRIRLRPEIVTLGAPEAKPSQRTGTKVAPAEWDQLLRDPEIVLIDTRNTYEVEIGTFPGAIDPKTESFGAFKDFVAENLRPDRDTKIAMFCTGGIRCEKASAYLLANGFSQVYQLHGGILKYLEDIPPDQSRWQGECFVFDRRVTLVPGLAEGTHRLCWECGDPLPIEADCDCALNRAARLR